MIPLIPHTALHALQVGQASGQAAIPPALQTVAAPPRAPGVVAQVNAPCAAWVGGATRAGLFVPRQLLLAGESSAPRSRGRAPPQPEQLPPEMQVGWGCVFAKGQFPCNLCGSPPWTDGEQWVPGMALG